jgi:TonB family protein
MSISLPDLKEPTTTPEDFTGTGTAGGFSLPIGVAPLAPLTGSGEPIDGSSADNPPYMMPGQMGPSYPAELRGDAPDGLVVVRFVIDTLGKVEAPSIRVLESTHPNFLASVRVALDRLRFTPARLSGQRVRVRMEQRFEFHLSGR